LPFEYEYIAVGHVTIDLLKGTAQRQAGGGALYSGLQASRLGLRTLIITAGNEADLSQLLAPFAHELDVLVQPTKHTTTFATTGRGADRYQRLLTWAGKMSPSGELDAPIVHFAPVAQETPAPQVAEKTFVCWTPQGLVRCWDEAGDISQVSLASEDVPSPCHAMVLSVVEVEAYGTALNSAVESGAVVAITAGSAGVEVRTASLRTTVPVDQTTSSSPDDLGAGDVFAAAFFVALHEHQETIEAVHFAQAAAYLRLMGSGPAAIGDRAAITRISEQSASTSKGHSV
jgi:sugar/nucleoside kinase (ribokinase family)